MSNLCCRYLESDSQSGTRAFQRFACGVGHMINDIVRQLLISFRLVVFIQVFGLSAANAGWLVLYNLICVAAASVINAFLIDNVKIPFLSPKLGRRKSWHLIGTVISTLVVPLYFSPCFFCKSDRGQLQMMIYLAALTTLLSFSFSLVEIGHLSIIPAIAKDHSEAAELNAWRTFFSFLSGIITFIVAWLIFGQDNNDHLSAESSMDFTVMTIILTGIGLLFAVIFHGATKEPFEESDEHFSKKKQNKTSFIPPHALVRAMTFQGTELCPQEQRMHDAFMDSLNAKGKEETKIEEIGQARKQMFLRRFVEALFSFNGNDDNIAGKELTFDNIGAKESASKGEEEMLREVRTLPNERKISVLNSILWGVIGVDPADIAVENEDEESRISKDINSSQGTNYTASENKLGVAEVSNKGHSIQLERCKIETTEEKIQTICSTSSKHHTCDLGSAPQVTPKPETTRAWLKDPHLYKVAIIFTCTMNVMSLSYSYLPLYLIYRVQFQKEAIAYFPLIMLISAAVSSGMSKKLEGVAGSKRCFTLAAFIVMGADVWFYFITKSNRVMTYPATALLGFGFSAMLVNALSFAAELIGENKSTCGVVYACMSLMSYLTNGTLMTTIQNLFPEGSNNEDCEECGDYVRRVFSFVPGSLAALSLLIVLLFPASKKIFKTEDSQTDARINCSKDNDAFSME